MADKLMYTPNDDTQNCSFYRLEVETFRHLTQWTNKSWFKIVPKVFEQMNERMFWD